jgi:hypothetical protein
MLHKSVIKSDFALAVQLKPNLLPMKAVLFEVIFSLRAEGVNS